jgi:hypothetical protein
MRHPAALGIVLILLTACGNGGETDERTTRVATVPPAAAGLVIHALTLAADGDGPFLVPVAREATPAVGPSAAVDALVLGLTFTETGRGLSTEIPPGVQVHSVATDASGVVTVDVSAAFEAGGGSAAMFGRLGQLVATVMQFPEVVGVRLAVDGAPVDVFSAEGIVLDDPMTMTSISEMIPAVGLLSPAWGADVTVPVAVSGRLATATSVGWSLVDWDGRIVAEGIEPVVDGRFAFAVPIAGATIDPEAPPYQHALVVWEDVDGSRQMVGEYVLTLRP